MLQAPHRAASPCAEDSVSQKSCQAPKSKIFRFTGILIYVITPAVPRPPEGRFAIVTARRAQDAMDAAISGAAACFRKGHGGRRTKGRRGRRNRVVLAPRPWRQAGREVYGRRRWQERPLTGESTKETVK